MIYDFEEHTPKIDPGSWVASNAVIIGRVELKKNSNIWFNTTFKRRSRTNYHWRKFKRSGWKRYSYRSRLSNYSWKRSYHWTYGNASWL